MKIAFVILNYNTYEETRDCILSVEEKLDTTDYRIVIVDNCSTDDSADKLTGFIKEREKCELIHNSENLGFARGNNVGIAYVNQNYNPEYVAVCNSDTEIISDNLVSVLDAEYQKSNFAVFGPLILKESGTYGKVPQKPDSKEELLKYLKRLKRNKKITELGIRKLTDSFYSLKQLIERIFNGYIFKSSVQRSKDVINIPKYVRHAALSGCFYVFSKKAFEYIKGFDERTFLYFEEYFLYRSIINHGLVMVYDPEVAICHRVSRAVNRFYDGKKEVALFKNKYLTESLNLYLATLDEMKE